MSVVARLATMVGWRDDGEQPYECTQCGHSFHLRYYRCPECGGPRVERTEWPFE